MYSIQDPVLDNLLDFLRDTKEFVFLDTSRPVSENVRSFLFIEPIDRIVCRVGDNMEKYLGDLQRALNRGYYLAGWVGYEFGAVFEGKIDVKTRPCADDESVIADFGVFKKPYSFNHNTGENNLPHCGSSVSTAGDYLISNLRSNMGKASYLKALEKVQDYIAAGDTYQVNYTLKLLFDFQGSPEKLYRDLRRNQTVAYGAYIRSGEERVLSFASPLLTERASLTVNFPCLASNHRRSRFF